MDIWNAVNLIGTVLTMIGTGLSFWQANKAKKYKEEIQEDRLKMILIDLLPSAKIAREECKKIITPVDKPMRGVDQQKIITSIQDFIDKVREHSHKLNFKEYEYILSSLDSNINRYKQITDLEKRFNIGDQIYKDLNNIISMINKKIDKTV